MCGAKPVYCWSSPAASAACGLLLLHGEQSASVRAMMALPSGSYSIPKAAEAQCPAVTPLSSAHPCVPSGSYIGRMSLFRAEKPTVPCCLAPLSFPLPTSPISLHVPFPAGAIQGR